MKQKENKPNCWLFACILGLLSLALPFLFALLRLESIVPSAILTLTLFTLFAAVSSYITKERRRNLSLVGVVFSLVLPSLFLIEPHLPQTVEYDYIDTNAGVEVRIIQEGKNRSIYARETEDGSEWIELSEAALVNKWIEPDGGIKTEAAPRPDTP